MRFVQIANESIGFQSSVFADALTAEFTVLLTGKLTSKDAHKHPSRTKIEDLITKYTGLNISFDLSSDMDPCTIPIRVNTDHVFTADWMKGLIEPDANRLLDKAESSKKEGAINLKEGKVYGVFTKAESPIFMNIEKLKTYKLTAQECTAILLHEIGHVFTYLEYMTRTVRTNQALAAVHRSLTNNTTKDEHKIILERAGYLAADDDSAFIELTDIKDSQTVTTVIIHKGMNGTRKHNELGAASANYDMTASEQLADQFAARHGMGRHLTSSLEKLHQFSGSLEYNQGKRYLFMTIQLIVLSVVAIKVITSIITLPYAGLHGPLILYKSIATAISIYMLIFLSGDGQRDRTYDDLRVRFLRVKEQSIQYLKDNNISDKESKRVIEDIKQIEVAISKVKDSKLLFEIISNYVFPSNYKAMKAADLQRDLEALAANDIFVKAKELSFLK